MNKKTQRNHTMDLRKKKERLKIAGKNYNVLKLTNGRLHVYYYKALKLYKQHNSNCTLIEQIFRLFNFCYRNYQIMFFVPLSFFSRKNKKTTRKFLFTMKWSNVNYLIVMVLMSVIQLHVFFFAFFMIHDEMLNFKLSSLFCNILIFSSVYFKHYRGHRDAL